MGKKLKPKIHVRDSIVDFLLRTEKFLNSSQATDELQIQFRLEKLEAKWDEFEEVQCEIEGSEEHEENTEAHRQVRAEFEEKYFEVRAGLVGKLPRRTPAPTQNGSSSEPAGVHTYVRLPQINLPEFDGSFEKWLPFHDTFRALIDSSPELSGIQKFHYLRASLRGDALKLVDSYPMSEANYRVAWNGLVARFSNGYLLKKRHLNAMFEFPKIRKESAAGIHDVIDCFERNTKILDQLGEKTSGWGAMLTHLLVSKLDDVTQKHWEESVSNEVEPSFTILVDFLKKQTRVLDAVSVDQRMTTSSSQAASTGFKSRPAKVSVNSATGNKGPSCASCGDQHSIAQCTAFSKLPVDQRLQLTNSKRLCSNCLGRNHMARDCPSKFRCRTCSKKHHSLLHPGFPGSGTAPTSTASSSATQSIQATAPSTSGGASNSGGTVTSSVASISSNMAMGLSGTHVFLLTAVLKIKDSWGRTHLARALLDSGSQANLMSENLSHLLKLPRRNKRVEISGIGCSKKSIAHEVSAVVSSRVLDFSLSMDFLVLRQVTSDQPSTSLPLADWKPPNGMELADPEFFVSGPIDLVLGSQFFYDFHLLDGGRIQICKLGSPLPIFVNTVFGWVAAGESEWSTRKATVSCHVAIAEPLDKIIEKFWAIEEMSEKPLRSQEEKDCEQHFQSTFTRNESGRYVVQYPKRNGFHDKIGDSKGAALRRFRQLERRLERDSDLRDHYNEFLQEYLAMGHMQLIGEMEDTLDEGRTTYYLPHHPVFKESSSTTKVRVVFDGSAKTTTNHSLNDTLLTGPVIQDDLLDIMIRFRKHAVALVADVAKMYRQVRIHPEDASLQRILWRFDQAEPIKVYELQTVTYGLAPSSFLATRVLKQLAIDAGDKYKYAGPAVKKDFYMDDFLSGAESISKAKRLRSEVQSLMAEGGFDLRKWSSNQPEALADLPSTALEEQSTLHFDAETKVKTLGVVWETGTDQLCVEIRATEYDDQWTKRKIFSEIAQLYDPLGIVSPVIAWAKIRMQHLWSVNVDWDDPIPREIESKWNDFHSQLPLLKQYKVPRYIFTPEATTVQFHVFCDASEVGYGACIYSRSASKEGKAQIQLIAAKSRVAPIKRLSLPRLELCAALLGAKLYTRVSAALGMEGNPCWFWSDSTVTLHWIAAPPNTWQTFVGNRTSEIQLLTHGHPWNHVKGTDNPADHVSRGMLPADFIVDILWRNGPGWLADEVDKWPKHVHPLLPNEDILERKKTVLVVQSTSQENPLFERYSSFGRLVRITAYLRRFITRCRSKHHAYEAFLSTVELQEAKQTLVKVVQQEVFPEELIQLKQKRPVPSKSPLKNRYPFLDENGIIRVGGRLHFSNENYQTKHPMALPNKHPLSRIIAAHFHSQCFHSGPRMTLATMRREFWPVRGKTLANYVCRKCTICFRHNPVPVAQPQGQLPKARIVPSRPFSITGVDYCGPIYLKPVHRRAAPQKVFIAVFVCFATKATHLELVCDLSTDAFIAALRRFIARRGLPTEIHSDNGTNFKGAKTTLTEMHRLFSIKHNKEKLINECSSKGITWRFIPPRAPNFGGLWEAAVKTAKSSLVKTIGCRKLSYEDMVTVLYQIEANMNTRPLTPLSDDPTELDALTPGHFLTGGPLLTLPDPQYTEIPTNRLRHYQQLQQLIQHHWQRWRKEYLTELNQQWQKSGSPVDIRVGQMVLLQEDGKPSVAWPLARIEAVQPGDDDIIRVATIKTRSGTYIRPIRRLFPLPFDQQLAVQQQQRAAAESEEKLLEN
ncbi:uncharacterized protein LOC131696123 [Topomyia yanbarensis]|uniref:uncharacterized protein LOC131696123 n=1 Tax=Topomyia yanbarensis TaxID=2498891 RepID=UPI00273CDBA0|nr:uncharacterized protein LOC131696123 [Topomyia yanbarensis]